MDAAVEKMRTVGSIGAGANRNVIVQVLKQLIAKTGISFITTQMGKGVVEEHPFGSPRLNCEVLD